MLKTELGDVCFAAWRVVKIEQKVANAVFLSESNRLKSGSLRTGQ